MVEPKDIANKVFTILKDFDDISLSEYSKNLASYEVVNEVFVEDRISLETYNKIIAADYEKIKSKGKEYDIEWSKIEYVDFIHETQSIANETGLIMETYFKNTDGNIYFVMSASFSKENGFVLFKVTEIEHKRKSVTFPNID